MVSTSGSTRGSPFTMLRLMTVNVPCSCVYLYSWFRTSVGIAPRLSSTTIRTGSLRSDSSRKALMSGIFPALYIALIVWIRLVLFT